MSSPRICFIFGAVLLTLFFAPVPPHPGSTDIRVLSNPGPFQSNGTRPLVIAHRGGDRLRPENTLAAFQHALELGSDVLEMDIRLTRDRIPVVFHDDSVERTTDGRGFLHEMTLAQVKSLDAGYHFRSPGSDRRFPYRGAGISVPTLEEVFQAFARVPMILEIKPRQKEVVDQVGALIERFQRWDVTMVASFHGSVLQAARSRFPRVLTSASPAQVRNLWLLTRIGMGRFYQSEMRALQVPEFYGRLHIADSRFIRAARYLAVPVHVWTVDEIDPMQRLIALGVDGIITGRPDRLRTLNHNGTGLDLENQIRSISLEPECDTAKFRGRISGQRILTAEMQRAQRKP